MDPFHARLARVGLAALSRYGFCLAGGYAVQAHGFVERRSEDVDLFATAETEAEFPTAVRELTAALRADGLDAALVVESSAFARVAVTDPATDMTGRIELGIDWRAYPPTQLDVGPVLHPDDAVAAAFA